MIAYQIPARATAKAVNAAREAAALTDLNIDFRAFDQLAARQQLVIYSALAEAGRLIKNAGLECTAYIAPEKGTRKALGHYFPLRHTITVLVGTEQMWGGRDRYGDYSDGKAALKTVLHEIGHAIHRQILGWTDFSYLMPKGVDRLVASYVSAYACTNAVEFVAETFAMTMLGKPFNHTVRQLYADLNGPEVRYVR